MKKISLVLLMLFMLGLIAGCEASCEFGDVPQDGTAEPVEDAHEDSAAQETAGEEGEMQVFEDESLGFRMQYPSDWMYEDQGNVIIFSGREGTEAYNVTVNMQNLSWGEYYHSFDDFYEDYKGQIEGEGGRITELQEEPFIQNGVEYDSVGFTAGYTLDGVDYQQSIIAVDRGDGVFHQYSYTAPDHLYDKYYEETISMLDNFELLGVN